MVTLMVPDCPGASSRGLNVWVSSTRSVQTLPVSDVTVGSNGCISATVLVVTGILVGAPPGPYGPINAGTRIHGPHGTSGAKSVAATVLGPTDRANRSGEPATPTPTPE